MSKPDTTNATDAKIEYQPTENQDTNAEEAFTYEQLIACWTDFAEQIKDDKPRMYQVLKAHQPKIKDTNILLLQLKSEGQKKDLAERVQNDLMGFLKKKLNNYSIELVSELVKPEDETKLVYTASDKFNYLAKQNELLLTLKKNLNLDLE